MPKKILLASSAIIVLTLIVGIIVGYGLKTREVREVEVTRILGLETSAVITRQNANAVGEVIKILDQTLTLLANGDTLAVPMAGDAIIEDARLAVIGDVDIPPRVIEFQDIKMGDKVGILIELMPDSNFIGRHIMILPE